jgi:hypothetical protein
MAALVVIAVAGPQMAAAQDVTWQSWTFDHDVSGDNDGLSLLNVTYQGRLLIRKLSFPVVRVFYDDDECGPYADRLGGNLSPIPWANNATLAQREFTLDGRQWYEIGIRDEIGDYDLYQVYYLSADGIIDGHLYSKGLQCVVDHAHYPNWRIDFDLDGAASDQIQRDAGSGFETLTVEFNAPASSALNHAWRVRDSVSGLYVDVLPGFTDFSIPTSDETVPIAGYDNNTAFGRRYRSTEDHGWTQGPNTQVPYNNGQSIDNVDVVFWYEAYMPHGASDGSQLWHSTGVRLVSSLGLPPPDTDGDGAHDAADNCTLVANNTGATAQCDADGDDYGNMCDADLDQSGLVNAVDYTMLRSALNTNDPVADLNCSGHVTSADYFILRSRLNTAPGPSGLAP